jgi:large subunit ribosomal protein L1
MDKKKVAAALTKCMEEKGKRKFTQSVELIMNFRGIDFNKPENRLNLDIVLPKGRGKVPKVVVFGETQVALDAKNAGADMVLGGAEIPKLATDPNFKKMLKNTEFISEPKLMTVVGKSLGQMLGARGKLPKPIMGTSVAEAIKQAKSRVKMVTKGKYLPVAQCLVGSETMSIDDLVENIDSVYEKVKAKVTEPSIKSVYIKLSMGKAIKAM